VKPLPIDEALPRLREALRAAGAAAVLKAPPGAGKTTRVPLALLGLLGAGGRIVMLEPRRLAAVSAARWMAALLGEEVGRTVGYAIRFERRVSEHTRVEVVTEGILTRRLQGDPGLEGVALVVFDEFHERSLQTDLALALCLDARRTLREDLRILVMSATLACGPVAALLGGAPVVESAGRSWPVEVRHLGDERGAAPPSARVARAVERALEETPGDVLAFLPGVREIRACHELLLAAPAVGGRGVALHPLYADLPAEEQERALVPGECRKVVIATAIAETSLTIEGVRTVVDSGLARRLEHHTASGLDRLVTVPVSRAQAEQRAGRAGREAAGFCYRLYSRHAFETMAAFAPPEILLADLSAAALELALWGARDPATLPWLDPPPAAALAAARRLLADLGALDAEGGVTAVGREMARLPTHPRLARLLLRAAERGRPHLGAHLAALLAGRDVLRRHAHGAGSVVGSCDFTDRIETLLAWRAGGRLPQGADAGAVRAAVRQADQFLRLLPGGARGAGAGPPEPEEVARLLFDAYPERLARRREPGGDRYLLAGGRGARLSPRSCVHGQEYLVAVEVDAGEGGDGVIHAATAATGQLVREEAAGRVVEERRVGWDAREQRVVATVRERFGAVVLATRPFAPGDEEAVPAVCRALREEGMGLLRFDDEARQLQARVRLLAALFPDQGWPDLADEQLAARPEAWLAPFLAGVRTARDLAGVAVGAALRAGLSPRQRGELDRLAPQHLEVPTGRRAALDYAVPDGPVLAVKLQELFGLGETPTVAAGRRPVLLQLLSPAGRPVQVTRDLHGFWNGSYREVKRELKGRYPKHPWPDDPWTTAPTRGAKPRKR
jgi:ATP-dependent helicase HrpB